MASGASTGQWLSFCQTPFQPYSLYFERACLHNFQLCFLCLEHGRPHIFQPCSEHGRPHIKENEKEAQQLSRKGATLAPSAKDSATRDEVTNSTSTTGTHPC